ncbi:YoaK family protein [Microbacterium sp. GXF7504]
MTATTAGTTVRVFPFMERPGIGALLALTAGTLNAWSLAATGTFATVQSGNLVVAGFAAAGGDLARLAMVSTSILCFGLGAALNAVLVTLLLRAGRSYSPAVLFGQAAVLLVIAVLAATQALPATVLVFGVSFVAGSQGNAFHRDHGMLYGNVAVTFVVQSFFSLLGRILVPASPEGRRTDLRSLGIYGGVLVAFAAGAGLGFGAQALLPAGALWLGMLLTAALGGAALRRAGRVPVDPSQNAPTP